MDHTRYAEVNHVAWSNASRSAAISDWAVVIIEMLIADRHHLVSHEARVTPKEVQLTLDQDQQFHEKRDRNPSGDADSSNRLIIWA